MKYNKVCMYETRLQNLLDQKQFMVNQKQGNQCLKTPVSFWGFFVCLFVFVTLQRYRRNNLQINLRCLSVRPLSNRRPHESYSKILRISKKEENHSICRVPWLFNEGLRIASSLMSTSKLRFEIDGLDVAVQINFLDILTESILILQLLEKN